MEPRPSVAIEPGTAKGRRSGKRRLAINRRHRRGAIGFELTYANQTKPPGGSAGRGRDAAQRPRETRDVRGWIPRLGGCDLGADLAGQGHPREGEPWHPGDEMEGD